MERNISALFNDEPKPWGLRGDPHLWDEMRLESKNVELPNNELLMKEYLYKLFYRLTGYEITSKDDIFIERYDHYGMSGGYVSVEWWEKKGIPFILERYKKILFANKDKEEPMEKFRKREKKKWKI